MSASSTTNSATAGWRRRAILTVALATCGFGRTAIAQDSIQSRIDQYMHALVAFNRFSGGFLVARDGQVVREGAFGPANAEWNISNTTDTKFRIGSITKQFTAMAVLILAERGKLRLSDPICLHIPECPTQWRTITIQQLLTHTAGIPDYVSSPSFARTQMQPTSPRALMARFRDLPLRFPP